MNLVLTDDFLRNYILTALWTDIEGCKDAYSLPDWVARLAFGVWDQMASDCREFEARCGYLWSGSRASDAGMCFWFSRNGDICGFAEDDWGEVGKELHEAAREFGPFHLGVSTRGEVIVASEAE